MERERERGCGDEDIGKSRRDENQNAKRKKEIKKDGYLQLHLNCEISGRRVSDLESESGCIIRNGSEV